MMMKSLFNKIRTNKVNTLFVLLIVGYLGVVLTTGQCPTCVVADLFSDKEVAASSANSEKVFNLTETSLVFTTLDGEVLNASELKGKPIVVNYWATWCGPCRRELPGFNSVAESLGSDVQFLGIALDEEAKEVEAFLEANPLSFPTVHADVGLMSHVGNIRSIPTTLFFDANGALESVHGGYLSENALRKKIANL